MVDGEDVDGPAGVGELPAGAALSNPVVSFCQGRDDVLMAGQDGKYCFWTYARRVPSGNDIGPTDVGEVGDVALGGPAVLGDQAVGAVRAGDGRQGPGGIVVAGVVGDCV